MDALAQKANEAPPAQSGQVMSPPYPNTILAASQPPLAGGFPATLITGTQGTVVNTFKGLSVSSDATLDTLSISLMMASREKPDTPLEVTGSLDFKASCVLAATFADLPITFADPAMQDELDKRKKEDAEEREKHIFLIFFRENKELYNQQGKLDVRMAEKLHMGERTWREHRGKIHNKVFRIYNTLFHYRS